MEQTSIPARMREIEIFGVPALFTKARPEPEGVYPGMSCYELLGKSGQFLGAVLTPVPLPVEVDRPRSLTAGDLILDTNAGHYTPSEFEEKYLSPDRRDKKDELNFRKNIFITRIT